MFPLTCTQPVVLIVNVFFGGVFIISNAGNLLSFIFLFSAYFQALKETCCTVLQCVASCDLTHFYSTCLKGQLTPKSLEIFRIQVISITSTMQKGEHMPGCRSPPADPLPDTSHAEPLQWAESPPLQESTLYFSLDCLLPFTTSTPFCSSR